ncbi:GNAT family N-acetyltransferase [Actinomadura rubrisoli]|uniref:GNAT family N-acetyltransferase n=1 Tax=Actinomadura rubrisoli TaxID=2530368 RepID=A0A4R5BUX5_9ACTN|nr:GNAT family N-acetyltransferase [Actinomadura rubrisoli]TDD89955.1 GNAT family N-acetyltransferase [Actinomadura rubrisoli]
MKQLDGCGVAHIAAPLPGLPGTPTLEDVRFRPYGIGDRDRLRRMSAHLSKASLYTRFFSGTPRIPEYYLRSMDGLDHWDREAMVALLDGEAIGIAEYVRDVRRPSRAEVAVLVADPWKRCGLGGRLMAYLAQLAGRRGVTEFHADVIPDNHEAVFAIRSGWPAARARTADGTVRFRLPLPMPGPARTRPRMPA